MIISFLRYNRLLISTAPKTPSRCVHPVFTIGSRLEELPVWKVKGKNAPKLGKMNDSRSAVVDLACWIDGGSAVE